MIGVMNNKTKRPASADLLYVLNPNIIRTEFLLSLRMVCM